MTISRFTMFSQTAPTLLLPGEVNESVQLNISEISDLNANKNTDKYLSVFVKAEGGEYATNAIQGRYAIDGDYLVFTPYFPFERGIDYVIRTKSNDTEDVFSYKTFHLSKNEPTDKAEVVNMYPSSDVLPENLLRFYFYFNTPMKKGEALKHIQLVDTEGNIDDKAFMEFKQELWSPDGKRLTLLFDPGRIKRGVSTNMELGPALEEGRKYKLIISEEWRDVLGQKLAQRTTKEFFVEKAYRRLLKVKKLEIAKPKVNTDDTLTVFFDRIIDHALVHSMIKIEDEDRKLISGDWKTSEEERTIHFIPDKAWRKGRYTIIMDSRLEDAAGNNLNNLLDHKSASKNNDNHHFVRSFTI